MENEKNDSISLELSIKEVGIIALMADFSLKFMLMAHAPHEIVEEFRLEGLPILERLKDTVDKKVLSIDTKSAIEKLNIRFGDKESPKDKPNE